jgi:hypothetical protein
MGWGVVGLKIEKTPIFILFFEKNMFLIFSNILIWTGMAKG